MSYSDLGIDTSDFGDTTWTPPVGATSYLEFGTGDWVNAPTKVKGVDEYDRPFVVTEPVSWTREKSKGFTALLVWLRYTPHQEEDYNPLMVSKPGGKSCHHIIPEEQVEEFSRFIRGEKLYIIIKNDGLKIKREGDHQPIGYSRRIKGEKVKMDGEEEYMSYGKTFEDLY